MGMGNSADVITWWSDLGPLPLLERRDLFDAPLVPAALERRGEPERDDLVGQPASDDPAAEREDVGVVVLPGQPGGIEIVAECGTGPRYLVGGHLLPLAAAADDDAAIRALAHDRARDRGANLRIVHRIAAVCPEVVDRVPEPGQHRHEMLFQRKSGMVRADRDLHDR